MANVVKSSSIYGIAEAIRGIASLIMLPIYTNFLAPSDYGVIELMTMVLDLFALIAGLRLGPAIIRLMNSEISKSEVVSASLSIALLVSLIGVLLITSSSSALSLLIFDVDTYSRLLSIFSFSIFAMLIGEIFMAILRAEEQPGLYLAFSVFKLIVQITLNLYFIAYLQLKAAGFVYSSVLTGALLTIALSVYLVRTYQFRVSKTAVKSILLFSTPLAIGAGAEFITTYIDRFLLTKMHGLHEVGIYSLAYKFGFVLVMISWYPISMAWEPIAYRSVENRPYQRFFHDSYYLIFTFVLLGTLGVGIFARYVIYLMAAEEYHLAQDFAYLICIAYLAQSIGDYVKLGFMYARKTIHMLYANLFSASLAVISYVILIAKFSILGAALGTILALGGRTIWMYLAGKKYHDLNISFSAFYLQFLIVLAGFAFTQWQLDEIDAINFTLTSILYIFLSVVVTLIGYFQLTEKGRFLVWDFLRNAKVLFLKSATAASRKVIK